MIVLWIILGIIAAIILLLVILLHFSVKAHIEADKKHLHLEVKYLGFKLYKLDQPNKNENQDEENEKIDDNSPLVEIVEIPEVDSTADTGDTFEEKQKSDETPSESVSQDSKSEDEPENASEEKVAKASLLEQFNEYKKYIPAGKKAFRKLLKMIRFYDLKFRLTVGNDDPYKAGLNFGRLNAVIYSLLGLICCIFSVKIDSTEIKCDFEKKNTDFYFKTAVYVRPSAVVALALYVGVYFLKIRKSMKKLENMTKEKTNNE